MSPEPSPRLARLDVAFVRLRRLWESPVLRRRFSEELGESVDHGVVRVLRAVDLNEGDCGVTGLAGALDVEASTASRLVDAAVTAGYLDRATAEHDRRRTVLTVTETGRDLLDRALRVREQLLGELTADFTDDDVEQLATLLERLAARIADLEGT